MTSHKSFKGGRANAAFEANGEGEDVDSRYSKFLNEGQQFRKSSTTFEKITLNHFKNLISHSFTYINSLAFLETLEIPNYTPGNLSLTYFQLGDQGHGSIFRVYQTI